MIISWALAVAFVGFLVFFVILPFGISLAATDLYATGALGRYAERLVYVAARAVPASERERRLQDWLADLDTTDSQLLKLWYALNILVASRAVGAVLKPPRASGVSSQTSEGRVSPIRALLDELKRVSRSIPRVTPHLAMGMTALTIPMVLSIFTTKPDALTVGLILLIVVLSILTFLVALLRVQTARHIRRVVQKRLHED